MALDKKQAQIQAGQHAKILENPQMLAAFNEIINSMDINNGYTKINDNDAREALYHKQLASLEVKNNFSTNCRKWTDTRRRTKRR